MKLQKKKNQKNLNFYVMFHAGFGGSLPLSSLRLMASPLQLTYSYIWQVIRQRNVKQYGKVEEFVTMVTQTVPELISFKQTAQLILGLRARVRVYHLECVCVCLIQRVNLVTTYLHHTELVMLCALYDSIIAFVRSSRFVTSGHWASKWMFTRPHYVDELHVFPITNHTHQEQKECLKLKFSSSFECSYLPHWLRRICAFKMVTFDIVFERERNNILENLLSIFEIRAAKNYRFI